MMTVTMLIKTKRNVYDNDDEQARKAQRCDSNLQSETFSDSPTEPLTASKLSKY